MPDKKISRISYQYRFDHPTTLCGPIAVTLWAKCTTLDTDFFVVLADVDAAGHVEFLQRGLLRASHRQLDEKLSVWTTVDGKKTLIRPRHTHRDLLPLVPNKPYRLTSRCFQWGTSFARDIGWSCRLVNRRSRIRSSIRSRVGQATCTTRYHREVL